MTQEEKDFFISYHKADHKWAEWIAYELEAKGYSCIFKAWDFLPGSNTIWETQKALSQAKRTLVILSPDYLNDYDVPQAEWMATFLQDPTGEKGLLIPIYVGECTLSGLLAPLISINLVGLSEDEVHATLLAGIEGTRLKPSQAPKFPAHVPDFPGSSNVLIASLGDSPAIITAMYDRLTQREPRLTIDRVKILCPGGKDVQRAYELVEKFFPDKQKLRNEQLRFDDADSWQHACMFLQKLCIMLDQHQEKKDKVYLSLAGGRKSMAALMAWVMPYFSCIEGLYHIVSTEKEYFPSVYDIDDMPAAKRALEMRPHLDSLLLVDIPFEGEHLTSEVLLAKLYSASQREFEEAEALITGQTIFQKEDMPEVKVTQRVIDQFHMLRQENAETAWIVRNRLLEMGQIATLRDYNAQLESYGYKIPYFRRVILHTFSGLSVPLRLVLYTSPTDIYAEPDEPIERVVICSLEREEDYTTLQDLAPALEATARQTFDIDKLRPVPAPAESVLIVPLGASPMVATQLYTLLKEVEQRTIREVVLIYPQNAATIDNGAQMIKRALRMEDKSVRSRLVGIEGLADITSSADCRTYQDALEKEIEQVKDRYPGIKIDLALSGGRKGMTAMTIFAAQKHHIQYVYHTLITEEMSEKIEDETTYEELNNEGLSWEERLARLFLRKYRVEGPEPYTNFVLFKVPVFTAEGW
jgi:CRISPR-associated Csx14 family protein